MRRANDLRRPGLTRAVRTRAGWCLALLYLACVLLPGLSLTFAADAAQAAPCLEHVLAIPAHPAADGSAAAHEHAAHAAVHDGEHHPGVMAAMASDTATSDDGSPHKSPHHAAPGPCCAMMCLSALPAAPAELAAPVAVTSRCMPAAAHSLTEAAPSRRDRPPMA